MHNKTEYNPVIILVSVSLIFNVKLGIFLIINNNLKLLYFLMAKSQQTFSKSEKEKKRLKKRLDKQKKMEAGKAEKEEKVSKK